MSAGGVAPAARAAGAGELLAHERVTADGARPERWLYLLHGIYGAGRNWGSVARALTERRPDWGSVLVDLRGHGASSGFRPPHTVAAAARDLGRLAAALRAPGSGGPHAVLGHSFGGKVALAYAATATPPPAQTWLIDSTPAPREPQGSAWRMLDALESMPGPFSTRQEALDRLVERGFDAAVARWMSSNLERGPGGLAWRIDPGLMRDLLEDFFALDLWGVLEAPPEGSSVHLVAATDSEVLRLADVERIRALEGASGRVRLHRVRGGHWLNADNPDAVVELLAAGLPIG